MSKNIATTAHCTLYSDHSLLLILASASPRRLDLLAQIGIVPSQVIAPDINEHPRPGELPLPYVERMAREKAQAVAALHPDAAILAADTVVVAGRRILPKAETADTARACLSNLSGRRHQVLTSVCVLTPPPAGRRAGGGRNSGNAQECPPPDLPPTGGGISQRTVTTILKGKRLTEREVAAYLATGEWQGKAGGYAIQGRAAVFFPWMSGSYSNVVGLPLYETHCLLVGTGVLAS